MQPWQWIYVLLLAVTLGVGWYLFPSAAVGIIMISIILIEALDYRKRMKKLEKKSEKA